MNKSVAAVSLIILFLLSGCKQPSTSSSYDSRYFSLINGTFQYEYINDLHAFNVILEKAGEVKSQTDITYLKGLIDAYLDRGIFVFGLISEQDNTYLNGVILPELQKDLLGLPAQHTGFVVQLKNILDDNDWARLERAKPIFTGLTKLGDEISDYSFNQPSSQGRFANALKEMKPLLESKL